MLNQNGSGTMATPAIYETIASIQTDKGCVREANEDSGRLVNPNDPALLDSKGILMIVADGMGGHASGEVASGMAVELISRLYYEEQGDSQGALKRAVEEANRLIYAASQEDEKLRGMGTTCTALVLRQGVAISTHVGDSRLYMVREGEIYLMTEDHSAVMEMVKLGIINLSEARHHPDKNVILRALGTYAEVEVSTWKEPLPVRAGDQFLLCSDGLYDLVEDEEIKQAVVKAVHPQDACEQLIRLAKERGGHDNITVGIISVKAAGMAQSAASRETREVKLEVAR